MFSAQKKHSSRASELRTAHHRFGEGSKKVVYHSNKNKNFKQREAAPVKNNTSDQPSFFGQIRHFFVWTFGLILLGAGVILGFVWAYVALQPSLTTKTYLFLNAASKTQTDKPVALLVRNRPAQMALDVVVLEQGITITLPGDYGQYSLDSVVPLLKLEGKTPEFTRAAVSLGLGFAVDEIQVVSELPKTNDAGTFSVSSFRTVLKDSLNNEGSMSLGEKGQLLALSLQLDQHDLNTKTTNVLDSTREVTSTWSTPTDRDNCSIAIVNTTKTSGVATALTTVLERSQLSVIKAVDTTPIKESSQVVLAKPGCEQTIKHLSALIPSQVEVVTDQQTTTQYRSDVVLLVGNDVAQFVK